MSKQAAILEAIALRNKVAASLMSSTEVEKAVRSLAEGGVWTDVQIAGFIGYSRPYVWKITHPVRAEVGTADLGGGRVPSACLDMLLELSAVKGALSDANRNLLSEVIRMGCSTRMIARVTNLRIGQVLYVQRKMAERKVVQRGSYNTVPR